MKISDLKKYCIGRLAIHHGNEFSLFYDVDGSGLTHRTIIAETVEFNQIFLTKRSKKALYNLEGQMSLIYNAELSMSGRGENDEILDHSSVYEATLSEADKCLDILYKELGLD